MSLFYQIVFPQNAPEVEALLQRQISDGAADFQLKKESATHFVVLQHNTPVASVTITHESDYLVLSSEEYAHTTDWYIELGKADGLQAMRFYMKLLGSVITICDDDFLSVFNGERIIARRENGQTYLNTESSVWKKAENLALLASNPYRFATYVVE